ncbi:hypothetical protein FB567DRAFT_530339 [Paraphoma chrysanthemicola]|uniref:Uncharacterized protein n=1 Tax=Paraphoma chrysanthemicola TaxID=798071 RepID=A0A8K0R193_9PLEO|nr:hypothetical protein FB567DRAFT_530339 [Paraphoma chrysanthemicola]
MLNAFHKNCCDELLSQTARYKKRCEEAELRYIDLLNGDRHLESIFTRVRNENRDIDMDMLRDLRAATTEIASLKRKLADRTALNRSVLTLQDAHQPTVARQIHSLLEDLKDGISSIPARNVAQKPLLHKLCEDSEDLNDLVRIISGHTDQQNAPDLNKLTLQELIQTLTGASICRWIFESDLHIQSLRFAPLLHRYRDQIGILHGEQVLYALDKSVHQTLIEEHDFIHTTIRTIASKHSQRLVTALRPLYGAEVDPKVLKKLRKRLQSVLEVALRIRCLSLVSTEEYECIWPRPGSKFDGKEMESHNAQVLDGRTRVKIPVAPGLRAYSKEPRLVSYSGFDTRNGRDATATSVIRAIVLI